MNPTKYVFVFLAIVIAFGCASPSPKPSKASRPVNQVRPIDAIPRKVAADTITVGQYRSVCDAMARDFIRQPFVVRAARPPVVTIRKIQNKTGIYIDEQIYQETIRAKLMENAGGMVLFRDDVSYKDIIEERVRQSNEELTVTLTDTVLKTNTHDRVRDREFESGSLSGASGNTEMAQNIENESSMDMSQTATVKSGVAAADYFLRGIIYQVNERDMTRKNSGMSYFQYQFRVVDARSGLIVWEKMLSSKMAGEYMLRPPATVPAKQTPAATGAAPTGWPTSPVVQPGALPGQTPAPVAQQPVQPRVAQQPPAQNPMKTMKQIVDTVQPMLKKSR